MFDTSLYFTQLIAETAKFGEPLGKCQFCPIKMIILRELWHT